MAERVTVVTYARKDVDASVLQAAIKSVDGQDYHLVDHNVMLDTYEAGPGECFRIGVDRAHPGLVVLRLAEEPAWPADWLTQQVALYGAGEASRVHARDEALDFLSKDYK